MNGRSHAVMFAIGDSPGKDQRLGAAADTAMQSPQAHLAGRGAPTGSSRISDRPGATCQSARAI